VTGNGGSGFDSGEGALEMATTSKEGSRRANYPILINELATRDNRVNYIDHSNEGFIKISSSSNWRASLVPAAAVIPAPVVYIKFVAVKKLVVGYINRYIYFV
jgi:hypothetical protein